jgi:hypothetical protein
MIDEPECYYTMVMVRDMNLEAGQSVEDYLSPLIKGGWKIRHHRADLFSLWIADLSDVATLKLGLPEDFTPPDERRIKYSYPLCSANAWGQPALRIGCGDCQVAFERMPSAA